MPADAVEIRMTDTFALLADHGMEQVLHCHDGATGLQAIIAIHSTVLGPALGGVRFHPYPSGRHALVDACRLAQGMTLKHALAGLDQGGGKAVIIGEPAQIRSEPLLRAFGRFVDGLSGRYVTAEDVGTSCDDMDVIRKETAHVAGVSEAVGGSGDPSPSTALGVLWAMRATAEHLWKGTLDGRHVIVSGVGKVGSALVGLLVEEGARVTIADVDPESAATVAATHGAAIAEPAEAHRVDCDIFAPCALGGVLSADRIPELRCRAVVGSANNQLATAEDAARLAARGVLYIPDFVANAGGIIHIAQELHGHDRARVQQRLMEIHDTVLAVLDEAARGNCTTAEAAVSIAMRRFDELARVARLSPAR